MKTWTKETPKKAGFYWWKHAGYIEIVEIAIVGGSLVTPNETGWMRVSNLKGEFCGPLIPPK